MNESTAEAWQEQKPLYDQIKEKGFAAYAAGLPGVEAAYAKTDRVVRCIDERVCGGLHAPGSLVMETPEEARSFAEKAQIAGITSHAGCGAAKLTYLNVRGTAPTPEQLEEFSQEEGKRLAEELGVPYKGHIGCEEMAGPSESHIGRTLYYVGSTDFDPSKVPGLPPGFILSRRYMSPDVAIERAALSFAIATDKDHAFGDFISEDEPFYLVAVGDSKNEEFSAEALRSELAGLAEKLGSVAKVESI